jgi:hypothetical protein
MHGRYVGRQTRTDGHAGSVGRIETRKNLMKGSSVGSHDHVAGLKLTTNSQVAVNLLTVQ